MISVVVCTHNRCQLLVKTLDSLRVVAVPQDTTWEVCVVDNNSSDPTPHILATYASQHPSFPLRYVPEPRPGVAFARNAGVEQAAGEVVAYVDDDVLVDPPWLGIVANAFAGDPELAVLGGRLRPNLQSEPPAWLSRVNTAPLGLIDYGAQRRVIDFPYLATANCAFRKRAIVAAGMFDTRLGRRPDKLYAEEDTEMVAAILRAGGKVVYEPTLVGWHFVPDARMTKDYFRRWHRERGEGVGLVGTQGGRHLLGIAFYEYRALLVHIAGYARKRLSRAETFQDELAIRYFAGIIAGRTKSVFAPGEYHGTRR